MPAAATAVLSAQALAETPSIYTLVDDDDRDCLSFDSTWMSLKHYSTSSQQTEPVTTSDRSNQSAPTSTASTQTAVERSTEPLTSAELSADCTAFLARVLAMMEEHVLGNAQSHAFDGFSVSWDEDRAAVTRLHSLQHVPRATAAAFPPSCTALSWNSSGSLLAASYGHLQHSGWCSHAAFLAVWNVHRRLLDPAQADTVVELTSCVSSLAFHPSQPSLIAVGLHTGQIRLLDLSDVDDPVLCSSTISSLTHCEPVTALQWVPALYPATAATSGASLPSSHLLLSSGLDGKVLTWSPEARLAHPLQGALCAPSAVYHGHGASNAFPSIALTALSLSSDRLALVVGTQAGGVLRGLHSQRRAKGGQVKSGECRWTKDAYTLLDAAPLATKFDAKKLVEQHALLSSSSPVIDLPLLFSSPVPPALLYPALTSAAHRAHDGAVHAVAFSPFHAGLFLTVSADRAVRLYRVGREAELWAGVVGEGGVAGWDVCWSISRPLVFAVADCEGEVGVWDLAADWTKPVAALKAEESAAGGVAGTGVGVVRLSWNGDDGSVLAGVDVKGRAHVWQLSGKLSNVQPGEQRMLDRIGAASR